LERGRLLKVVSVAEGDQIFNVIAFRLRHLREFIGHSNLVMNLEIKTGVSRSLGFFSISAANLTGIAVTLENLLTETLGIETLKRISAIARITRCQPILTWTQSRVVHMGVNRPTVLIP
jgi:hypothetical protein